MITFLLITNSILNIFFGITAGLVAYQYIKQAVAIKNASKSVDVVRGKHK